MRHGSVGAQIQIDQNEWKPGLCQFLTSLLHSSCTALTHVHVQYGDLPKVYECPWMLQDCPMPMSIPGVVRRTQRGKWGIKSESPGYSGGWGWLYPAISAREGSKMRQIHVCKSCENQLEPVWFLIFGSPWFLRSFIVMWIKLYQR